MKKFVITFLLATVGLTSFAQQSGRITGKIVDGGNQRIIDAATISLLKAKDSSLVKISVAEKDGSFAFINIRDGRYVVLATSVGHTKVYSQPIEITAANPVVETGTLQLIRVGKNMSEVVVTSKKQFIERKIDKLIINPEASITSAGSSAMEILEKSPGISVDKDGNISMNGKQGVIIMIDGKPSYMGGQDLANFLRNLPASNLEQLEIMTNPSAKYDASGNSGIINLKTKKNKQKGFNGSLALAYGQGKLPKTNNSLNLNYRVGKVNIFSTLSGNYREGFQKLDIHRRYTNTDKSTKAIFDQQSSSNRTNKNYNANLGMDYYANKKTTLGFVLIGYTTPGSETGSNTSYPKNSQNQYDSIVQADRLETFSWKNGGINVNMRHSFDSTGRELTADADYISYRADRDQHFSNSILNTDYSLRSNDILIGELPSDIKIYSAKLDYTHPLRSGIKIETGLKYSYVTTDNVANYYNQVNNVKTIDWTKTNHFQYKENINAGYINVSRQIKKWGFQAGLRIENTISEGHQFGNPLPEHPDSSFKKSYTNAFPTAYVSYTATDKHSFGLNVGRRINRPSYQDLNPFLSFLDKFTYEAGNPYLRPMYSNVFEISHTYKQFLTTTLNYSHTKDLFNETFDQMNTATDSFATVVREGNYGIMNNISIAVNAQLKPFKWWTVILYGQGRYQEFKGELYGAPLDVNGKNFTANINNQFNFKKGWGAEVFAFYRTTNTEGQIIMKPMSQVHLGVKKDILKNKGSLKLSIRDVYGPMRAKGNINFKNTEASFKQHGDNRVVTLNFNYRFGKPIKGLKNRKSGGAGEEQNRIKSAN